MKIVLRIIVFISFSGIMKAQEIKKTDLIGLWRIEKYEIANKFYNPTKKDKDDFMLMKGDGSLVSKSEGVEETGAWTFDASKKVIVLKNSENESLKAQVIQLKNEKLVLYYQNKELKDIVFHYKNNKHLN